jgi:hypothetical protein
MRLIKFLLIFLVTLCLAGLFFRCKDQKTPEWLLKNADIDITKIDASDHPIFSQWLTKNGKAPLEYAIEKCKEHQIVVFGEVHVKKDYLDFLLNLIPEAYHKAGVTYVALEVCTSADNDKIARLLEGSTFDYDLALEIARGGPRCTWGYKEYWDIFEVVWKLNRNLPEGKEHMKVIGINPKIDLQLHRLYNEKKLEDQKLIELAEKQLSIMKRNENDQLMVETVEKAIIEKGAKGIVWIGYHHSFTKYAQPRVDSNGMLKSEWPRFANILHQKYGDEIFQIACHHRHDSPEVVWKDFKGEEPIIIDFMEKIMLLRKNEPVSFDVFSSPFANLRDSNSYYFYFQPGVKFADLNQGYLFIKPYEELSSCSWIENFINDDLYEEYKLYFELAFNRKLANAQEVNDYYKSFLSKGR